MSKFGRQFWSFLTLSNNIHPSFLTLFVFANHCIVTVLSDYVVQLYLEDYLFHFFDYWWTYVLSYFKENSWTVIFSGSADSPSLTNKSEKMMDTMVNTPTPVRQLVAQFDNLHVDVMNKNCDEDSNHDKSLDSGAGGILIPFLSSSCCSVSFLVPFSPFICLFFCRHYLCCRWQLQYKQWCCK